MIRPCKLCGKEVDFSEPWCDHETMEESAWIDIESRMVKKAQNDLNYIIDDAISRVAKELGKKAAELVNKKLEK